MQFHDEDSFFPPTLRGEVDTLFDQVLGPIRRSTSRVEVWSPQLDVTEEEERFILEMDIPGVRREDLDIRLEGRTLIISGQRRLVRHTVGPRYRHCERYSGSFHRAIPLPLEVEKDRISANIQEGILRLELPKKGAAR